MITEPTPAVIDCETMSELVQLAWNTFIGDDIAPTRPVPSANIDPGLHATISIGGPWIATIAVSMGDELVRRYAAELLQTDAAELDDADIRDAFGELANVVGGNVKGLLDDSVASSLSLPVVSSAVPSIPGGRLTVELTFDVFGLPMVWEIYERI